MNSEDKNTNNEEFYKAMSDLSLPQLEDRARRAGCKLEIEFDITEGQSSENDTFQEGGRFIATFIPIPEEEIHTQVKWPSENDTFDNVDFGTDDFTVEFDFDVHLNGISEEDFQDYDKLTGEIDLTGISAYNSMSADVELKEEIVSILEEKQNIELEAI